LFWKQINTSSHISNLLPERKETEQKEIPEPNKLLMEYSMACENGISKLQENAQDDLLWFICKVMPAVQKKCKPI